MAKSSKRPTYDCWKDGEYIMNGTCEQIARRLKLSIVTVMQYRYKPHNGIVIKRNGEVEKCSLRLGKEEPCKS